MSFSDLVKYQYYNFLDIIAPNICAVCNEKMDAYFNLPICNKCMARFPIAQDTSELTNRLLQNFDPDDIAISEIYSLFSSKAIDDELSPMLAIYKLKYGGISKVGFQFGLALGDLLLQFKAIDYDYLVPVPIHSARLRERGYNQSESIAMGVSKKIGVKVNNQIIKRKRYTLTQTKLNADERKINVKNIYKANKSNLKGVDSVLLIDDVLTTGSTLNYLAIELLESGIRKVDAATIIAA